MKILYLGNKLSKHGYTPTGVEYLGQVLENGGYTMYYASDKKNVLLRMLDMWRAILSHRFVDLILIDTYSSKAFYYAWLCGMLAHWMKVPFVLVLRGGDFYARATKSRGIVKGLFRKAAHVVSVSKYLKETLSGFHETTYIPNTLDISKYPLKIRRSLRARLLWVRSLHEVYNPELAVKIVSRLSRELVEVSLAMVGPDKGNLLPGLRALADAEGVEDRITWTGKLSKKEWIEMSARYDIFINTTNVDNMPVSVIEAMALGLPVVSTNVGGVPFLIEDGVDGVLVPPDDLQAFCDAIRRLLMNTDIACEIAQNARKKAESFDNKVVLAQWKKLIDEIVQ